MNRPDIPALQPDATVGAAASAFAELGAALERCGWTDASPARRWMLQTPQGPREAAVRLLRGEGADAGDGRANLAFVSLPDWISPEPGELMRRLVDLPLVARLALDAARRLLGARWLLLAGADAAELFSLPGETREVRATGGWETSRELLPALAALARRGTAPPALHTGGAEGLGGWLRRWTALLAPMLEAQPAAVERMMWKWVVMLQLARRGDHVHDRGQWGVAMERLGDVWEISYDATSSADQLRWNLERFDQVFATRALDGETARQCEWVERLDSTHLTEQLRAELLMQAQHRFEPESAAWLFTDIEREQAGWRREIGGEEPIRRRLKHDGWNVFEPLMADVAAHGLGAALRDADRLAQYWHDHDAYAGRLAESGGEECPWGQPDLFCNAPRGVDSRGRLEDGINFLYGESLRLIGVAPEARLGVAVVFLLKAVALNQTYGWPLRCVDTLDPMIRA